LIIFYENESLALNTSTVVYELAIMLQNESLNIIFEEPDWYKDAIIYELHVRAFFDRDNDGIGDFLGLTEKLD